MTIPKSSQGSPLHGQMSRTLPLFRKVNDGIMATMIAKIGGSCDESRHQYWVLANSTAPTSDYCNDERAAQSAADDALVPDHDPDTKHPPTFSLTEHGPCSRFLSSSLIPLNPVAPPKLSPVTPNGRSSHREPGQFRTHLHSIDVATHLDGGWHGNRSMRALPRRQGRFSLLTWARFDVLP